MIMVSGSEYFRPVCILMCLKRKQYRLMLVRRNQAIVGEGMAKKGSSGSSSDPSSSSPAWAETDENNRSVICRRRASDTRSSARMP